MRARLYSVACATSRINNIRAAYARDRLSVAVIPVHRDTPAQFSTSLALDAGAACPLSRGRDYLVNSLARPRPHPYAIRAPHTRCHVADISRPPPPRRCHQCFHTARGAILGRDTTVTSAGARGASSLLGSSHLLARSSERDAIASRECSLINSEKRLERRTMLCPSSSRPRVHSGRPVMDDIAHGADIAVVSGDKRIFAARNAAASVRATTGRLSSGCRSVVEGVSGCERKE